MFWLPICCCFFNILIYQKWETLYSIEEYCLGWTISFSELNLNWLIINCNNIDVYFIRGRIIGIKRNARTTLQYYNNRLIFVKVTVQADGRGAPQWEIIRGHVATNTSYAVLLIHRPAYNMLWTSNLLLC